MFGFGKVPGDDTHRKEAEEKSSASFILRRFLVWHSARARDPLTENVTFDAGE
jgi:hypothetical protein